MKQPLIVREIIRAESLGTKTYKGGLCVDTIKEIVIAADGKRYERIIQYRTRSLSGGRDGEIEITRRYLGGAK